MPRYFFTPAGSARFESERSVKLDVARGERLFVGLNCFEPGQSQAIHAHAGADKFYLILSGNASMLVGDEARDAGPGTLVWAPAGVPHGVAHAHERTVMLVAMSP
jgi:quercetin dioxygenase-like cupin family protein